MLFALTLYVLLDGFDLGVGVLLLAQRDQRVRDRMVDTIAPTWDRNEIWLIMAGITSLAGLPLAYSVPLPALYLPLVVMLLSLGIPFKISLWQAASGTASHVFLLIGAAW